MANDLSPGFVKLYYTANTHSHVATLPALVPAASAPGSDPTLTQKDGNPITAAAAVAAYVAIIKTVFPAAASFTAYEVFKKAIGAAPVFLWSAALGTVGTNGSASIADGQAVYTFRTVDQGGLKLYLMESAVTLNQRLALSPATAGFPGTLATYILGATNWIIGRDTTFPISGIYYTSKTNDALRKRRLLDA